MEKAQVRTVDPASTSTAFSFPETVVRGEELLHRAKEISRQLVNRVRQLTMSATGPSDELVSMA
jgi:hypothetical protein